MTQSILKIALPTPLNRLFDYVLPREATSSWSPAFLEQPYAPGIRVQVPFGKQTLIGILIACTDTSDISTEKLKSIHAILDQTPVLPPALMALIQWISRYYHSPLGEVFDTAIPAALRKGKPLIQDLSLIEKSLLASVNMHKKQAESTQASSTLTLNPHQHQAIERVLAALGTFQPFLLEGVTGSGKTEVYLRIIEKAIADGQQALILVPEIGLTPQMIDRFQTRFDCPMAVLHSGLSEKKRLMAWQAASLGLAPIVIGTRSAVFTPLKNPGIFIIDEEHDVSFKQQEGLRYSARDTLIMRAQLEKCPVVLGTATPALETFHNAHVSRYQHLTLPLRTGAAILPKFQVLDVRHKKLEGGLAPQLIKAIQTHLEDQAQVLLFLNRRGFAPVFMCFDCGQVLNCQDCDARLILHHQAQVLKCHHCEKSWVLPKQCASCQSKNLHPLSFGTERVEATLNKYFGEEKVVRIDRDTIRKKGSFEAALNKIHSNAPQILLGTQMITKGHHFPNVTLVGILDVDSALFSLDYRSTERVGQLITQVAGRAGRAQRLGEVWLQTFHPEHRVLTQILSQGYGSLSADLLHERRLAKLPPFSYQALFRAEAKTAELPLDFLDQMKMRAQTLVQTAGLKAFGFSLLGPIPAPMARRQGHFRFQLLMQAQERPLLHRVLAALIADIEGWPMTRKVRWSLDVDPIEMY